MSLTLLARKVSAEGVSFLEEYILQTVQTFEPGFVYSGN